MLVIMKPLRIGIMGCANVARKYVFGAITSLPEFEVSAVASRDLAKAGDFARQNGGEPLQGYDRLVDRSDVDAVYVPLPTGLHAEWVEKLLRSGKHVMVEKSLGASQAEADRLIALARSLNLVLLEHFQFLHHRQTQFMLEKLAEGSVGSIRVLRACFGFPPLNPGNFRYRAHLGGGALLDAGAYTLRAAQLYLGKNLHVAGATLYTEPDAEVETRGSALLKTSSGITAELAWGFDHFYQCSVELWGTRGRLLQDRAFTAPPGYSATIVLEQEGGRTEHKLPPDNHFVNLWRHFHDLVSGARSADADFEAMICQARLINEVKMAAGKVRT